MTDVDEDEQCPRGYEIWGSKPPKYKDAQRILWQPTKAAIGVSYDRLVSEGYKDVTIRKVGSDGLHDSPRTL